MCKELEKEEEEEDDDVVVVVVDDDDDDDDESLMQQVGVKFYTYMKTFYFYCQQNSTPCQT